MSFGSRLKERREAAGLSQKRVGEILGVSGNAVGNYEAGVSSPNANVLYKLFDILHCDANYLYQDEMREQGVTEIEVPDFAPVKSPAERLDDVIDALTEEQAMFLVKMVEAVIARKGPEVYAKARDLNREIWEGDV